MIRVFLDVHRYMGSRPLDAAQAGHRRSVRSLLILIWSSSTKTRMADERLCALRLASIISMRAPTDMPLRTAISLAASQNASSKLMLVLWPRNTIERFLTCDLAEAIAIDLS